uniref:GTD-binding domain-containing protein n=1 Tax=Aegilops tauschii subsp. strangulata TaxID=200361 RepID=A0A453BLZ2_AEGTS
LHAHGIRPADENCYHEEERPGEHIESEVYRESSGTGGESGMNVMVVKKSVPPPPAEELEYTKDMGCAAATKAVAVEYTEEERVDGALELYARVEALEADRAATRREVAALRAEPAREVLAREMARRLCRESAAVTMVHKPRFSVLAICKVLYLLLASLEDLQRACICSTTQSFSDTTSISPVHNVYFVVTSNSFNFYSGSSP